MRKSRPPSDEEISDYLKSGWHYHKKQGGDKVYIVRRKGQATRGSGRYSETLWRRIQELEHQLILHREEFELQKIQTEDDTRARRERRRETHRKIVKAREGLYRRLSVWRGMYKYSNCRHKVEKYCKFWFWEKQMPFFSNIEDMKIPGVIFLRQVNDEVGNKGWIVKADSDYCNNCPAFEPIEKRESCSVLSELNFK
jgi:hypothetical protein